MRSINWPWTTSLAQRVLWGYYVFLGIVLVAAVLQWVDLSRFERRMSMYEATGDLLDSVLDLRRFEKNWFFYRDRFDFAFNSLTIAKIQWIISVNKTDFMSMANGKKYVPAIQETITEYKRLMNVLGARKGVHLDVDLENQVRRLGHELVNIVHRFRQDEKIAISKTLRSITSSTVVFGILVLFLVVIIGDQLATSVVQPLRQLITTTQKIADGHFDRAGNVHEVEEIKAVHAALGSMLDKIKEREKEIVQSKKLAALGTLVAGVAHELNNPLSNIATSTEILREELHEENEVDREFWDEMLGQILDQAERAKRTVRSLLEFSREKEMFFEYYKLSDILMETRNMVAENLPADITLRMDIQGDGAIFLDRQRIQQVLINLINNAVQAMDGSGEIAVSGSILRDRGIARISVVDNGPGIPREIQEKIFDPFFSTKDVGEGSGLGLSITHEIVTKHHGRIYLKSEPGKGAAFIVDIPVDHAEKSGDKDE